MDAFDRAILAHLLADSAATQSEIGDAVNLSGPAVGRRQRALEEKGLILGYQARIEFAQVGYGMLVMILIQLERQSRETLEKFEVAIAACPSVMSCHLLSGSEDYLVVLRASDLSDFERIHRAELSELPGVTRMQSLFSLREVVSRPAPPGLLKSARSTP